MQDVVCGHALGQVVGWQRNMQWGETLRLHAAKSRNKSKATEAAATRTAAEARKVEKGNTAGLGNDGSCVQVMNDGLSIKFLRLQRKADQRNATKDVFSSRAAEGAAGGAAAAKP